ncbi:MAG TPA: TonB family protein [Gammaproteobacteria bacterium]|nr:TonB family protein [Gammaproteobacteria bacterium]
MTPPSLHPKPRHLLAAFCALLAACAAGPKPPAPPPSGTAGSFPTVRLMIATPVDEAGPASIEARLSPKDDSQVLLRFTLQPDGRVQEASVLTSRLPEDSEAAVLAAFSALRFLPYLKDGKPASHEFVYPLFFGPGAVQDRTRFFCRHASEVYRPRDRCDIVVQGAWRVYRITPAYPDAMLSTPVAGAVTLGFDLDSSGVPSNVKVLKSTPPGAFDTAAMVALQQWYFEPLDGAAPAGLQHASVTVDFKPPSGGY